MAAQYRDRRKESGTEAEKKWDKRVGEAGGKAGTKASSKYDPSMTKIVLFSLQLSN
ncbi:MAG: hypothetical protein ACRYGK_00115 [Janthinobacterium lividum]